MTTAGTDDRPRLVVLASGGGTNCQAILDACANGSLHATVAAVVTNWATAGVVARATAAGIPVEVVSHRGTTSVERQGDDEALAAVIAAHEPTLVVLAGWMRLLTSPLCSRFDIINLHPALPGEFPGLHAIERAFEAWQRGDIARSGVMIHRVPDEAVDAGPVVATREVDFLDGDTLARFEARMHETEHALIVEGVAVALADRRSGPMHTKTSITTGATT